MATKYFRNNGTSWNTDANWSTTTGGSADTTKPTASDAVILDDNSKSSCVIDAACVCLSLTCNTASHEYAGTLSHSGSNDLTVSGDLLFSSGMTYTPNSRKITINANANIKSAGKTFYNLQFTGGTGKTYTLQDDATVSNTFTCATNDTATNTVNGYKLYIQKDMGFSTTIRNNMTGTTEVHFTAVSGTQTITVPAPNKYSAIYNPVVINSGGTVTFSANAYIYFKNITFTAGTFNFPRYGYFTGTLTYNGGTLSVGSTLFVLQNADITFSSAFLGAISSFYDFDFRSGASGNTLTLEADMYVSNALRSLGTDTKTYTINGSYKIYASGDFSFGSLICHLAGTSTIEFTGSNNQSLSTGGAATNSISNPIIFNKSDGTFTFSNSEPVFLQGDVTFTAGSVSFGSALIYYLAGTMTYNGGTIDAGTSTLRPMSGTLNTGGITWYNIATYCTSSSTLNLSGDLNISNNLTLTGNAGASWTWTVNTANSSKIVIAGNIDHSSATSSHLTMAGSAQILLNGTGSQSITGNVSYSKTISNVVVVTKVSGIFSSISKVYYTNASGLTVTAPNYPAITDTKVATSYGQSLTGTLAVTAANTFVS